MPLHAISPQFLGQAAKPAHTFTDHFVGPQHPFFGITSQRCHTLLKLSNWQQKGILEGHNYIFVAPAFQAKGRVKGYCINHWSQESQDFVSQTFVTDLRLALVLANSLAQGLRMSSYRRMAA